MNLLTPEETLRAIADGVKLERKRRWFDNSEWEDFDPLKNSVSLEKIFRKYYIFRLRQEAITIDDVSFPKPESSPPKAGAKYWVVTLNSLDGYNLAIWTDTNTDKERLARGLVHLSEENAIAHAKALIQLSGGKVDD